MGERPQNHNTVSWHATKFFNKKIIKIINKKISVVLGDIIRLFWVLFALNFKKKWHMAKENGEKGKKGL